MEKLKLNIQLFGGSLAITAYETDVSIENNTSYVYVELKPSTNSTTYNEGGSAYVQATLTGQNDTYSIPKTYFKIGKGKTVTAYSGKIGPFHHNADGSLNNVSISASCSIILTTQPTASASVSMSTIPRASTISSVSGNVIGSPTTVTISRQSSSFTHKLQVIYGEKRTEWIDFGSATSKQFTIPMDFCNSQYLTSTTSGQFIFELVTYSNGEPIGVDHPLYTIYVPDSVKPSTPSVTKSDTNGYLSTYGAYVKGKSTLQVVSSANGSYGSTITGYTVKFKNGDTVLSTKSGSTVYFDYMLNFSGTATIEVTATDTRGRSTSTSSNITVADYTSPTISTFTAERRDNDDVVTITYNASITNINNANQNSKTFQIQKRKKGDTSWNAITQPYTSAYTYSGTITNSCDENYSWEFIITATDSYTTTSKQAEVGTTFELMNWKADGTGMAIGKVSEDSNTFEVDLDTKLNSVSSLKNKSDAGFEWDVYGNWKHRRTNTTDNFHIDDYNGNVKIQMYPETGDIVMKSMVAQANRPSTPNFDHQYPNYKASMRFDIASSEMNSSGVKPRTDGFILTFFWDNSGEYDAQLFIPNGTGQLQTRFKNNGTWSSWYNVYSSQTSYDYYSNTSVKWGYIEVWKCGNVVQFTAPNDVPSLAYGDTYWLNLPAQYRPNTDMCFASYNNKEYVYMKIKTNGDVYLCNYSQTYTGAYNFGFCGTYLSP